MGKNATHTHKHKYTRTHTHTHTHTLAYKNILLAMPGNQPLFRKTRARWETLNCVINKLQMCLKARLSFWPDIRMYITVRRTKRSDKSLVMGMFFTNDAILTNAGIWSHFSLFIFSSPFKFLSFELLSSQNLFIFLFVTTAIPSENRLSLCCFMITRRY